MVPNDVFPTLHTTTRLIVDSEDDTVYDVQFYPYGAVDDDQIFAVVSGINIIVCRPKLELEQGFEILTWLKDQESSPRPIFNSLVWARHPVTKKPLVCVAGHIPKHIKILDVESGEPFGTLSGHGKGINDLAVSPLSTSLLASCAEDSTIRLWNLEPEFQQQPCVAVLAGEGHKQPLLAIHFHPNGKWLLSGGIDTAVCLWAVPGLDEFHRSPEAENQEPMIIYYPSFYSKELHSNYVDSLAFYGDLIISKSARDQVGEGKDKNEILIWKIDGFDSSQPRPSEPAIPVPGVSTRSAFEHDPRFRGFQRLLTLSLTHCDRFYHRFGLLHAPGTRPILAFGNQQGLFTFWDLQRFDEGLPWQESPAKNSKAARKTPAPTEDAPIDPEELHRSDDDQEEAETNLSPSGADTEPEYPLGDRYQPLEPHHKRLAETKFHDQKEQATSQIAWSPDGTWMVGVGDWGMVTIWHRDKAVIGSESTTLKNVPG
ncbi:WD40 repeat [Lecanosticta acicola]|uniref:WD40 repeat n=1 Tax=Lecanosticta acicola TaxID=111012 RepID=A0AAI8YZL8_9PEZI|nr:WD40 repeat [Lecanosticta acicola]